ncbi:MAG: 3-deoxy-7-phosphoheptulonate synthase [Elusimicrobia bacterium]|nr:3-deoxy-7-phosphoheptulonate synthase [Elusimicrobiota bacterium]
MILTLKRGISKKEIKRIENKIRSFGFRPHISRGAKDITVGVIGENAILLKEFFESDPAVASIAQISKPYKLSSRQIHPKDTRLTVGNSKIGGGHFAIIAGPCSVESRKQIISIAKEVKKCGAKFLRGGAFKPRTSPYSFQGLGEEGLKYLAQAKKITGLPVVTEVMQISQIEVVSKYADVLQIGARNMQNFNLLKEIGKAKKPVLLKRGMSATITELLMAAEYIMSSGNSKIILCERGIRTFSDQTRFTLDISAIPVLKKETHLPVIVDPSHATGKRDLVPPMALAALAAGADGIMVEVHIKPDTALSDSAQTINIPTFKKLVKDISCIAKVLEKKV